MNLDQAMRQLARGIYPRWDNDNICPVRDVLEAYQNWCGSTESGSVAVMPFPIKLMYLTLGLTGEAGEVAEKIKKLFRDRDGVIDDQLRSTLKKELGDVLWYLTRIASMIGLDLREIFEANRSKLDSRQIRGTIHGNGDER